MISRVIIMELKSYCEMIRRDGLKDEDDLVRITARAKYGEPEMQALLGDLIISGQIADREWYEGVAWLFKASDRGNPDAMYSLSKVFSLEGLDPNGTIGKRWLQKAGEAGCSEAQIELGMNAYHDDTNLEQMDKWFTSALNGGNPWGVYFLGTYLIENFSPGSKEYDYGITKLCSAAEGGSLESALRLFRIHCDEHDRDEAYKMLRIAADLGDSESVHVLEEMYLNVFGTVKSLSGNEESSDHETTITSERSSGIPPMTLEDSTDLDSDPCNIDYGNVRFFEM